MAAKLPVFKPCCNLDFYVLKLFSPGSKYVAIFLRHDHLQAGNGKKIMQMLIKQMILSSVLPGSAV